LIRCSICLDADVPTYGEDDPNPGLREEQDEGVDNEGKPPHLIMLIPYVEMLSILLAKLAWLCRDNKLF
jgi:hypothetical protein